MINLSLKFVNILEKIFFSFWGLTILDLIPVFDFSFLEGVGENLKVFITVIGSIYFLIQIVFKTIELNHKRKYNKGLRRLQREEIEMKEKELEYFKLRKDYHTEKD